MAKTKLISPQGLEAGLDEAGRGCLAGPVFAAAVILGPDFQDGERLNDSKTLSLKKRMEFKAHLEENALAWAVASVSAEEIDRINILNASFLAMHRALDQLKIKAELLLIDGNRFKAYPNIAHRCEVKGDGRFQSIAAASILAKTHRDLHMQQLHEQFPNYHWDENKGYPTESHRQAIAEFGPSEVHRKSFRLLPPAALF